MGPSTWVLRAAGDDSGTVGVAVLSVEAAVNNGEVITEVDEQ